MKYKLLFCSYKNIKKTVASSSTEQHEQKTTQMPIFNCKPITFNVRIKAGNQKIPYKFSNSESTEVALLKSQLFSKICSQIPVSVNFTCWKAGSIIFEFTICRK